MSTLIKIDDLSIRYPGKDAVSALKHINLKIKAGETVGLVGESGCGKTTLALAIMGMLPTGCEYQGKIKIDGKLVDFYHRPGRSSSRDHCAMIFQNPQTALNPVITVGKQITRIIQRQGNSGKQSKREQLKALLQMVELSAQCEKLYPHELSGGMQQRVLLAMALARKAKILIADEPTTALDASTRLQILSLLNRLQEKQNLTILFISHDLSAIARVCQQVLILYQGRVIEQAPQELIFKQPRHPYSAGLLAAIPKIHSQRPEKLLTLTGDVNLTSVATGCAFALRCPREEPFCEQQIPPLNHVLEKNQLFACFNPRPLPGETK